MCRWRNALGSRRKPRSLGGCRPSRGWERSALKTTRKAYLWYRAWGKKKKGSNHLKRKDWWGRYCKRERLKTERPSYRDSREKWLVFRMQVIRLKLRRNKALLHNKQEIRRIIQKYGTNRILSWIYLRFKGTKTRYKNFSKRMNITRLFLRISVA
jgi:hypothetical protein